MLFYKNISNAKKTFHGVTFLPNETKAVKGYINSSDFIRVSSMPKEPPKRVESTKNQAEHPTKVAKKAAVAGPAKETIESIGGELDGTDSNK